MTFWYPSLQRHAGMQHPATTVCPLSCRRAMSCLILLFIFQLSTWFPMEISTVSPFSQRNKQTLCQILSNETLSQQTQRLPCPPPPSWQLCLALPQKKTVWGKGLWYLYGSCLSHFADTVQSSGSFFWTTLQAKETPWAKVPKIFLR